ncbi:MAG: hypothetical protein LBE91_08935 [Tannerella sp.]|jgi:uncharacterized Zn finger protein (UPF0148 family)|nr:hypothetical protein [Tannerella sp.]
MEENKKPISLIERMKQKAMEQKTYGGEYVAQSASVNARACPNCGAGRAEQDGLTHCAYCGFEFLSVELTDGINIKKEDNSITI